MRCSKRPYAPPTKHERARACPDGDALAVNVGMQDVIRRLAFLTTLTASSVACDVANPTLAIRVEVSPVEIVAGGNGTATIRVTVVNLTAAPVERVLSCDNLYAVENAVGDLVVSNYRVTCPV